MVVNPNTVTSTIAIVPHEYRGVSGFRITRAARPIDKCFTLSFGIDIAGIDGTTVSNPSIVRAIDYRLNELVVERYLFKNFLGGWTQYKVRYYGQNLKSTGFIDRAGLITYHKQYQNIDPSDTVFSVMDLLSTHFSEAVDRDPNLQSIVDLYGEEYLTSFADPIVIPRHDAAPLLDQLVYLLKHPPVVIDVKSFQYHGAQVHLNVHPPQNEVLLGFYEPQYVKQYLDGTKTLHEVVDHSLYNTIEAIPATHYCVDISIESLDVITQYGYNCYAHIVPIDSVREADVTRLFAYVGHDFSHYLRKAYPDTHQNCRSIRLIRSGDHVFLLTRSVHPTISTPARLEQDDSTAVFYLDLALTALCGFTTFTTQM